MIDPMGIGVVVVSHNSAAELPTCLQALCEASAVARVVVVDNASDDGSAALLASHAGGRVRLVLSARNLGFAGGCNRGLEELELELPWVAFVNPDVVVEPDCLARAAAVLAATADLAAVAPRLMRAEGGTVDSVGQVLDRRTLEVRDRGYGAEMDEHLAEAREVLAACGALALFRRAALDQVDAGDGPWAGHYFCFWEDLELGWRLVNSGWRVETVPEAVAVHGRGAGAFPGRGPLRWRRPVELEACILSNRWMTMIRHLHTRDLWKRLPLLLTWDLAMVAAGVLRRPQLAVHLARRLPLVRREWRNRTPAERLRLAELPW